MASNHSLRESLVQTGIYSLTFASMMLFGSIVYLTKSGFLSPERREQWRKMAFPSKLDEEYNYVPPTPKKMPLDDIERQYSSHLESLESESN